MRQFSSTPVEMFFALWRNRHLIFVSTKREVIGRYRGSVLGLLWSLFNPMLMLSVYTFIFSEVFKSRWGSNGDSKSEFALILFIGLIVFNVFAECINRAPGLILSTPNYVKKVIFPLEILPIVCLLSALFHGAISLGVWLLAYFIFYGLPFDTIFYLPLILGPLILLVMGLSWALASLGVYLRDVGQFIGVVTTVIMFLSPIFYPATALPENYRSLLYLNPLTPVIEQTRAVLYFGESPDLTTLSIYWAVTIIVAWLGFVWFQKTRKGFADVL
jgi:lipopolysaccharide transport system permease protein